MEKKKVVQAYYDKLMFVVNKIRSMEEKLLELWKKYLLVCKEI